jgi:hypothetical protein
MLAKQCWRLWDRPESLCAKILKAKYYANTSVLEAKPKRGMLYSWRSILRGLEVMKLGMIWRVGDGRNLKIWTDSWIPREFSRRPITPRGRSVLSNVDDLIDPGTGTWDAELVRDVFWEQDAEIILSLPVNEGRENFLAWHYDEHGLFTVKSAYKVCRDNMLRRKDRGSAQGGSNQAADPIWEKIWKTKCPNKVKHFVWRFAQNSHPLRRNLARRGMKLDTKCPVCSRLDEDGGHLFFKCKLAKHVWCELKLEKEWDELKDLANARDVVDQIMKGMEERRLLMFITLWTLWSERNTVREEGRRRSVETIVRCIRTYAAEVGASKPERQRAQPRRLERWARPLEGYLKLNL